MQDIWERNHESWGDVELFIVNSRGSEDGLPDLTDGVTLPVFQDTSEDDVYTSYGAEKWYFYYLDRQGVVQRIDYYLSLPAEEERFLAAIAELEAR
ncbi:MAG: hypothetical protein H6741_28290 [Alphaproteobacteria bacterium]|nr:hypothetical protein [Alphaproteobacteria bacterium]MCB9796616.1 hypothetical protein [Alphaproteobacteria bacterium]